MDEKIKIEGEKIFLTPMTLDDAEIFVKWRNSDYVMSRFFIKEPFTVEGQRNWIKNKVMTDEVTQFVVWDKADNVRIGSTYLINFDRNNKKCEYGMLIGEEQYAGGGRGSEMARLTSDFGLQQLGFNKVYCRIMADNIASVKACEKGGFSIEGLFKEDIWVENKPFDEYFLAKFKNQNN
ncbi:GNAT family N-acetyltransferase [Butyrivibrio sp. TB]|uniref:GNAT family N-acetyltransferase n=1 Tax=Butyrivibrio sp. TB TaxID=1520809 RepID=UPI0008C6D701|nr:GNAT family N-acetyltransferase [Butyrivibrio sp. TB]SEQ36963.1 Acetyltransferase (GNAT) domain-containing protein [Butyrivibrio sp. TB]